MNYKRLYTARLRQGDEVQFTAAYRARLMRAGVRSPMCFAWHMVVARCLWGMRADKFPNHIFRRPV